MTGKHRAPQPESPWRLYWSRFLAWLTNPTKESQ